MISPDEHFELENKLGRLLLKFKVWQDKVEHGFFVGPPDLKIIDSCQDTPVLPDFFRNAQLHLLRQVHGNRIVVIKDDSDFDRQLRKVIEADGWFYRGRIGERAVSLGILTADCSPVMIKSKCEQEIALVHCGWKGAKLELLKTALSEFTKPESCEVVIGPAADICCYEVGDEFFNENFPQYLGCKEVISNNYLSIPQILRKQAIEAGVRPAQIYSSNICTICNLESYSFRRQAELAGRQLCFVSI